MNQSAVQTTHRGGRTLLVALAVGLLSAATVVGTRPLDASAATVGISYVANSGGNSVTEYAVGATGNATPVRTISGTSTGLNGPYGVALDAAGTLYVANDSGNSVTEYATGATGNVTPLRTISGAGTGLNYPAGVALDAAGTLYVANQGGNSVTEYATGATGNVTPLRTISGAGTGLDYPFSVALDAAGTLYVANIIGNSVTEYATGATGNATPLRTISGAGTGLSSPDGVALDAAGTLYVANQGGNSVTEYATGATGNVTPLRTISGAGTGLNYPAGVALDAAGTLYVANYGPNSVTEYATGATGNATPLHTIRGASTGLNGPLGVVVTAASATVQESSPSVSFDSWVGVIDSGASGGTYRSSATKPATASFHFSGTGVQWVTRNGPDQGIASVTIDGVSKGSFDLYAATAQDQVSESFAGLTSAGHKIVIKVTGTKNAASTGTGVAVDAFVVGATTTQDSSTKVSYDTWTGATSASASGGAYRVSGKANATSGLSFSGTSVQWITATGPAYGEAEVIIDGVNQGTVDLYSASVHWQVAETYSGLAPGTHTIVVKVLGIKNAASTSTKVVVDAYVIS